MKLILAIVFFVSTASFGIGIRNAKGKVDAFDKDTVTINLNDGTTILIPKKILAEDEIANLKPNTDIEFKITEADIRKYLVVKKK